MRTAATVLCLHRKWRGFRERGFVFQLMSEIARTIWAGFVGSSWLDLANLVLGIVGVVLMVRRSLWAFPVGLVAVSVQGVLFWRAKFPADAALQVFFFITLAWGWWHWVRDRGAAPELPVTRLGWRGRAMILGLAAAATAVWALTVGKWTGAVMPWRDAFIAAFSVAAQVLQARKNIENWPLWLIVNAVAIAAYWKAELAFTAFLYAVYFGLALAGWRAWRTALARPAGEDRT
jgi:nicotinamide mononucleotide transporter